MKLSTYDSLNFKEWLSNSTIEFLVSYLKICEVNLYCFYLQPYLPLYHFTRNESIILFSSIYLF